MKRKLIAFVSLLTLVVGFAQLQNVLPTPLQRLMGERHDNECMMEAHKLANQYSNSQYASTQMINGIEMVDAFIDIENESAVQSLRKYGVIVNCVFDDFVTAQIPLTTLDRVSDIPGVKGVEISRIMEFCTDSTLSLTHAGQVLNGPDFGLPQAYDGSGVIVGIIDNGFDYQHMAFRSTDDPDHNRIVRVYDPVNNTGHEAIVDGNTLPGSIFMGEQIDTLTTDGTSAHGTHTTSIAAGKHVNGYGGMAPGADIVLCSSRMLNIGLSEVEVVNCIKYIYSYADSVGKPCVISVSVSTASGPHDGSDRISKAVASSVGPGRIFVIAAGNNASKKQFCSGLATDASPLNLLIGYNNQNLNSDESYYYPKFWLDTWVRETRVRPVVKYHILDKTTGCIVWESPVISVYKRIEVSDFSDYFQPDSSVDNTGYMYALITLSSSGKYNLQCQLYNLKNRSHYNDNGTIRSRYQVGLSIYAPSVVYPTQSDSCYVYSWMCNTGGTWCQYNKTIYVDNVSETGDTTTTAVPGLDFYAAPSDNASMGTYAVHDSVISAGGYIGRNSYYSLYYGLRTEVLATIGARYYLSSYQAPGYGPTKANLPTITAPSYNVIAACNKYSEYMTNPWISFLVMNYNGHGWGVMSGTSMAAPTVAGIIAQWLQINPNLSPSDVKNVIAHTAIKDSFTMDPVTGYRFGPNGKIDAMAGVQYLLSQMEEEILLGDINGDGRVSIMDVSKLISYLLYSESTTIVLANSDVNSDGLINIRDVTSLITLLLTQE